MHVHVYVLYEFLLSFLLGGNELVRLNESLLKLIADSILALSSDNKLKELTGTILKRLGHY